MRHNTLFESMGWSVIPFSMQHPNNIISPWSEYFVDEIEFGSDYSLWEKMCRVPKIIYSIEAQNKIAKLLDNFQVDICHAHNIYHHISPSVLKIIKQHNIPIVMTLHDLKLACPAYNMLSKDGVCERCKQNKVHNVLFNRCIKNSTTLSAIIMMEAILHRLLNIFKRCVDQFVVPSHFYIEKLSEWGWDKNRFVYIPNAVDVDELRPIYAPGKSFLYFGRLSREKGVAALIKAASISGVSLQIIGTGPEEHALRKLTDDLGSKVTFLGYLSGADLHNAICSSRAVVLPSEWYENAPMSILEAYALGKPVIGADIGGIPELIHENETGTTFAPGSVEGLAQVLSQYSKYSDKQISDMGRSGRTLVETEFSLNQYSKRMIDLYRGLGIS